MGYIEGKKSVSKGELNFLILINNRMSEANVRLIIYVYYFAASNLAKWNEEKKQQRDAEQYI